MLDCARRYAAFVISLEPCVRRTVRAEFFRDAELWTFPTPKGIRELDEQHTYSSVRRIERKPLQRLRDNPVQFLLIAQAEQEGYIRVEFRLPENQQALNGVPSLSAEAPEANALTALLCERFLSVGVSNDAYLWNQQRRMVIHEALQLYLLPQCEVYVRATLTRLGQQSAFAQISRKLNTTLCIKGFEPTKKAVKKENEDDDEPDEEQSANWRIFSFVLGDPQTPSYVVSLNRYGGVLDHLCLHHLKSNASARGQSEADRAAYQRKKDDTNRFLKFMASHKPSLLLLDASSMDARGFREDLEKRILPEYEAELVKEDILNRSSLRVEWADPELARIYMNSARAELEFKDYPRPLRMAIGMGRQALDPISEYAGTFSGAVDGEQWAESASASAQLLQSLGSAAQGEDALKRDVVVAATNALVNDMLALRLHPMQRVLPVRGLLQTIQRVLVRRVNYAGVDINKLVSRPWLTGTLQFLNGLGPIKSKLLLDFLKRRSYIAHREELLVSAQPVAAVAAGAAPTHDKQKAGVFGPCVFRNVAGFLQLQQNALMDKDELFLLDKTRIHPESYKRARLCCYAALDKQDMFEEEVRAAVIKRMSKLDKEQEDDEDMSYAADRSEKNARRAERQQREEINQSTKITNRLVRDVYENILALEALDLEVYCNALKAAATPDKPYVSELETLRFIVRELLSPFEDYAHVLQPFRGPSPNKLFHLLTNESSRSLREGVVLPVVINGIHPQGKGAYVRLDSGLRGFLSLRNISNSAPRPAAMDDSQALEEQIKWVHSRLRPGLSVNARVLFVEKDRFMVELSTRSDDLNEATWLSNTEQRRLHREERMAKLGQSVVEEVDEIEESLYGFDPYLYRGQHPDDIKILAEEEGPVVKRERYLARNVSHTLFHNVNREEAIALLQDRPVGDLVIRPSSIGTDHLTLTWKVSEQDTIGADGQAERGIFFHVDIKEEQKPNDLELGARLIIKADKYVYEDLDEIAARFIQPTLRHLNDLAKIKSFRYGSESEINSILFAEKQADPSKFPLCHSLRHSCRAPRLLPVQLPAQHQRQERVVHGGARGLPLPRAHLLFHRCSARRHQD